MAFSETDISLLHTATLLRGLPALAEIEEALRCRDNQLSLAAETVFLQPGSRNSGLFLIAHGTVELLAVSPDGGEKIVEFIRAGGMFGEETLFGNYPGLYLARTITPSAVLHLPEETVGRWLEASPQFARRLMGMIAERIDYVEKDVVTFCTKSAAARLVCYLVCQFNKAPVTPDGSLSLNITLPRNKLASRLGVSDSHLSRAFNELERQGLIAKRRGGILIPDVQALSRYVCPAGCDW